MKKALIIIIIFIIMLVGGFYVYQNLTKEKVISSEEKIMPEKIPGNKKVAMIIAFKDFRDEEYFVPREILEKAGVEIKTASNKTGTATGADGGDVKVDLLVSEINLADFDAIIFVGGPGCLENLDNEDSYRITRETVSQNKILASICISPVILAKAGVLKGKMATVWSSPLDRSPVKILKEKGAIYQDESVVVDGKIITANGPQAAEEFGQTILKILNTK
jgi:protease I